MNTFFEEGVPSRRLRTVLGVLASSILLLGIFSFGVHVGERKARSSDPVFRPEAASLPRPGRGQPFMLFPNRALPNAHGVFGRVTHADEAVIIVRTPQGQEREVITTPTTAIRRGSATVPRNELIPSREVAVFGTPTSGGRIEAMLIRLLSTDQP